MHTVSISQSADILYFNTVADCDSMGRVVKQTRGRAFQILGRAFDFLLNLQKLGRVF